jgi:hypothetical protein
MHEDHSFARHLADHTSVVAVSVRGYYKGTVNLHAGKLEHCSRVSGSPCEHHLLIQWSRRDQLINPFACTSSGTVLHLQILWTRRQYLPYRVHHDNFDMEGM